MLTRVLAVELGGYNVRVNTIAPGLTRTELTRPLWSDPEVVKQRVLTTPLGRLGEVGDIAGAALFFASDASSHITGEAVFINGGVLL
ncbi:SDR family NAD(P)-dependent oxidoreductase, partial [Chloroflexota bacterium]